MSNSIVSKFFNPDIVRQRLETHLNKESDNVRQMHKLDNLFLLDFQECKLKGIEDYRKALGFLFSTRMREYDEDLVYLFWVIGLLSFTCGRFPIKI